MKKIVNEFKAFIMRGNVLDLAVAVIIATAFKPIIDAVVSGVLMPVIGRLIGEPSFEHLTLDLGDGAHLAYGLLITKIINFILIGLALFAIIKAYGASKKKEKVEPASPLPPTKEEALLTEIRDLLKK